MKIPKRFKLLGHTIEVTENPALMNDRNWNGAARYDDCKIELLPISDATPRHITSYEQTFCHELMHYLLWAGGGAVNHELKDHIHHNEEFVDLMGGLLHQVLTTAEYE